MSCKIAPIKYEGFQAYIHLKQFFEEPERANIESGYFTKCHKDAWNRGFMIALRTDVKRFPFLKRTAE